MLTLSALMKRAILLILGAAVATGLTSAMCSAESAAVGGNEQTITEELKAQEDPTIIKRRIWSDTEWNKYKDGSHDIEETLGVLWAWRVSDSQEWGVRLKVPLKFHIAGDTDEDSDKQGLGTLSWRRPRPSGSASRGAPLSGSKCVSLPPPVTLATTCGDSNCLGPSHGM